MTIMRWKPLNRMDISDYFRPFFDDMGTQEDLALSPINPSIDIYETDDLIVVNAELPGMEKKDVQITVTDNVLTIKGEKKLDEEIKKEKYHRIERAYGSFSRSFSLTDSVDSEQVKANFKNGILEIKIPRKHQKKAKEISIE
jgi:HSP20 family protein